MTNRPNSRLRTGLLAVALAASACSNPSPGDQASLALPSADTAEPEAPPITFNDTTPEPVTSNPDDLRTLWNQIWVATGLEQTKREAAVAELADSLTPDLATELPAIVPDPDQREVLTDPAFTTNPDGSINIRDCVLYSPPYQSLDASYIREGKATPDGQGGWTITQATPAGQGCIPTAMNDKILNDYAAYMQAFNDASNPPDPNHPSLAETMTGDYLDAIVATIQLYADQDQYLVDLDSFHPEITEVPASNVVRIQDCVEHHPDSGVFDADGTLQEGFDPTEQGDRSKYSVQMRLEGGQWKTESIEIESKVDCQIAPTPVALQRIPSWDGDRSPSN